MEKKTKRFLIKTAIKLIVMALIITAGMLVVTNLIINNELALGQMQNDNSLFMLYEFYNNVKPIVEAGIWVIAAIILASVGFDVYKFFKTQNNTQKENNNEKV